LNELDCLGDERKNNRVVASCGELFRNPFTAGLLVVPQQHIWQATNSLSETHRRVDAEIASLLTDRRGANLMETLRMLNWVAAPSTQHSAARTPWGARWIHMFGFRALDAGALEPASEFRTVLGISDAYKPEFIEVRIPSPDEDKEVATLLAAAFSPDVPPQVVGQGRVGSAQFVLPSIQKTDLTWFASTRGIYDRGDRAEKIMNHSLLLDQGILLSEPSERMKGMAGASLYDAESWVAIPLTDLLGERQTSD